MMKPEKMEKATEKDLAIYLKPTFAIESDHEQIIRTALEVTRGCTSNEEKAVALFYFVRDSILYNLYMISLFIEDFRASKILAGKNHPCKCAMHSIVRGNNTIPPLCSPKFYSNPILKIIRLLR